MCGILLAFSFTSSHYDFHLLQYFFLLFLELPMKLDHSAGSVSGSTSLIDGYQGQLLLSAWASTAVKPSL